MDRNERLTYLDSKLANDATQRIIDSVLENYKRIHTEKALTNSNFYEERVEAIKNALFLKYTGIEFEGIFQSIFIDNKLDS